MDRRIFPILTGFVLLCALLISGCGYLPGATTPRELLVKGYASLAKNDKQMFMSCWHADTDTRKYLKSLFDSIQTLRRFKKAVDETYGPEAWVQIAEGYYFGAADDLTDEALAHMEVTIEKDKAKCIIPRNTTWHLLRVNNRWMVDGAFMPDMTNLNEELESEAAFRQAIKRVTAQVGKKGQSPHSLRNMLQRELQ